MRGGSRSIARRLGFACAGALALAGEPSLARTFRTADTQAADYATVEALRLMDQLVRERTGGDEASFEAAVGPMVEQLLVGPGMKTLVERIRETR
jgi:TRAP-type C4-dicarboxylate transport system substrate-binding protein